jgi:hypothetical protein
MPEFRVVTGSGRSFDYPIADERITIGRSKDNYVVLFDHTASRLEKIAQPNQILIGEATYQAAKGAFHIVKVGKKTVKGKSRAVTLYEVLDDDQA